MLLLLTSRYFCLCGVLRRDPLKATITPKSWTLLLWNLWEGLRTWERPFFFFLLSWRIYWLNKTSRKSIQVWLMSILRQMKAVKEQKNLYWLLWKCLKPNLNWMFLFYQINWETSVSHKQWKQLAEESYRRPEDIPSICQCHQLRAFLEKDPVLEVDCSYLKCFYK